MDDFFGMNTTFQQSYSDWPSSQLAVKIHVALTPLELNGFKNSFDHLKIENTGLSVNVLEPWKLSLIVCKHC